MCSIKLASQRKLIISLYDSFHSKLLGGRPLCALSPDVARLARAARKPTAYTCDAVAQHGWSHALESIAVGRGLGAAS